MPLLVARENQAIDKLLPEKEGPENYLDILNQIDTYEFVYNFVSGVGLVGYTTDSLVRDYRDRVASIPNPRKPQGPNQKKAVADMSEPQRAIVAQRLDSLGTDAVSRRRPRRRSFARPSSGPGQRLRAPPASRPLAA